MGCQECRYCSHQEDKNQFEYPTNTKKKIENSLQKSLNDNKNNNFFKEFEEKLKYIGQFISEEDFKQIIPPEAFEIMKNEPFKIRMKNENVQKIKPVEFENGNTYYGNWNENYEMEGYGQYYLKEENVMAEGIWERGELKQARIFFPNGDIYEGEMSNSVYNGRGKLITHNKDEYIGEFVDGEKSGRGKMIFEDKAEYNGFFSHNNFNGEGNIKWNNGIEYRGNFSDNQLDGKGTLFNKDGEKYEGNFEKNFFYGKGKYTYLNGDEYKGNFEYGIRKGNGVYKKKDEFIFDGIWDNNVPNGFGKIIINENILKCNFHNGKIIGDITTENGSYTGDFDRNFFLNPTNLNPLKLTHIDNDNFSTSQYRAGSFPSFLED